MTVRPLDPHAIPDDSDAQPECLLPFADNLRQPMPKGIIYNLLDYLELIDWTGRQIRENKTGSIDGNAPPILLRIGIAPEHWIELCTHFEERFKGLVGSQHSLKNLIKSFGLNRNCLLYTSPSPRDRG